MTFGYLPDHVRQLRADVDAAPDFGDFLRRRIDGGHFVPSHLVQMATPPQTPHEARLTGAVDLSRERVDHRHADR